MKQLDVSIVIVNWNTKDILRNCLQSIYEQAGEIDFEVIVIDNASNDGSAEMLDNEFPYVISLKNVENKGFAVANNQGIAVAQGRYILLLNSDTVVLDSAVAKTVSFADRHQDAGVVGCRVLNPDGSTQQTCFMFPSIFNMFLSSTYLYKFFPDSSFFGRERMACWKRNDVREVDVVTGCFMLVRRDVISKVGVLDERFFMYGEETDWCYRCRQAGWKILFTPSAEIIHLGAESSKQAAAKMILLRRGSKLLFFKKHKGRFVYSVACLFITLFFFLRVPYWAIRTLFSKKNKRSECLKVVCTYIVGGLYALSGGARLYQAR